MISPQSGRQINSEVNNDQTISVIYFEVCPFYWDSPASVHTDTHTHSEFPESSVLIFQVTHTHTHTHTHTGRSSTNLSDLIAAAEITWELSLFRSGVIPPDHHTRLSSSEIG